MRSKQERRNQNQTVWLVFQELKTLKKTMCFIKLYSQIQSKLSTLTATSLPRDPKNGQSEDAVSSLLKKILNVNAIFKWGVWGTTVVHQPHYNTSSLPAGCCHWYHHVTAWEVHAPVVYFLKRKARESLLFYFYPQKLRKKKENYWLKS